MTRPIALALLALACGSYSADEPGDDDGSGGDVATGGVAGSLSETGGASVGGSEPVAGAGMATGGASGSVATGGVSTGGVATGGTGQTGGTGPNSCPQIRHCEGQPECSTAIGSSCGTCQFGTYSCGDERGIYASDGTEFPCDVDDCSNAARGQANLCASPNCGGATGGTGAGGTGGASTGGSATGGAAGTGGRMLWSREFSYTGTISAGTSSEQVLNIFTNHPTESCMIVNVGDVPHGQTGTVTAGVGTNLERCLSGVPTTSTNRHAFQLKSLGDSGGTVVTGGETFDLPYESRSWRPRTVVRRITQNTWTDGSVAVRETWEFWE